MIYGVCGASGVGKTTVCERLADSLNIEFVRTSISEAAKRHGFDAIGSLSISQRLDLQEKLLVDHIQLIQNVERPAILDRTPVDFAAYMMAEIHMHSYAEITQDEMERISRYVRDCHVETQANYDCLFHLAPLLTYEPSPGRPKPNVAYQMHCDLIMRGVLSSMQPSLPNHVPHIILNTDDLGQRLDCIHHAIESRLNDLRQARNSHPYVH